MIHRAIILSFCCLSLAHPSQAQDAQRGRLIGNGKDTPREIVANKPAHKRAAEIYMWMRENGAISKRACVEQSGCGNTLILNHASGGLIFKMWDDKGEIDYCRINKQGDTLFCYNMHSDKYFKQVFASNKGEWVITWREPSAQSKPKTADIEM